MKGVKHTGANSVLKHSFVKHRRILDVKRWSKSCHYFKKAVLLKAEEELELFYWQTRFTE